MLPVFLLMLCSALVFVYLYVCFCFCTDRYSRVFKLQNVAVSLCLCVCVLVQWNHRGGAVICGIATYSIHSQASSVYAAAKYIRTSCPTEASTDPHAATSTNACVCTLCAA